MDLLDFIHSKNILEIVPGIKTKLINIPNESISEILKQYQKFKSIRHENFVKIIGIYKNNEQLSLVTEYFDSYSFKLKCFDQNIPIRTKLK